MAAASAFAALQPSAGTAGRRQQRASGSRVAAGSRSGTAARRGATSLPPPARRLLPPPAAIRGVESFDGSITLPAEQQESLEELLHSELFCQQVVRECKLPEGSAVAYTGVLFQPVPWSPATKKGMPADVEEQYYAKPEQYTIINVPPVFMFQAKILQSGGPPRLCAVYKRL